jgi:hypothetical protein
MSHKLRILSFLFTLFCSVGAQAALADFFSVRSVGFEIGASADWLVSDVYNQAFGLGLGSQASLFMSTKGVNDFGLKARIERVWLKEDAITGTSTSYMIPGSKLYSCFQSWWLVGIGVESRKIQPSHEFFWEATVGYAFAVPSEGGITVGLSQVDSGIQNIYIPVRSTGYVGGGMGVRRKWFSKLNLELSLRTFFLVQSIYTGQWDNRALIPVPFMISFGTDFEL